MLQKVKDIYSESIQIQISASSLLSENIATATQMVLQCLLSGHKVIACGVARSYANAQFLVSNLLNRYDFERPSLPSVHLSLESAVGSSLVFDQPTDQLYQHQFNAIAKPGDLLLAFAPLGTEKAVLNTISNAVNKEIQVEISIPATKEARILENHLFVINALCELVDSTLFPRA